MEGIVCQHLTVARIAEGLGRVLEYRKQGCAGRRTAVLINHPARFDGVKAIGVDELCFVKLK